MNTPDIAGLVAKLDTQAAPLPCCPTHPDSVLDTNGRCPTCHMDAVERRYWLDDVDRQIRDNVPRRFRDARAERPDVLAWVDQFVTDPLNAPSLLLLGPTGTGKTHEAYGALRAVLTECQVFWKATTAADMLADLRPHPGQDSEETMGRYRKIGLLLLDDLGASKNSEWVEETLYRVLDGRYAECRQSIFTTNLALAELRDAIGDRIASRLAETCVQVVLDGPDRRRKR